MSSNNTLEDTQLGIDVFQLMINPAERVKSELSVLKDSLCGHSQLFRRLLSHERDMILTYATMLVLSKDDRLPNNEQGAQFWVMKGKLESEEGSEHLRVYTKDSWFKASEAADVKVTTDFAYVVELAAEYASQIVPSAARKKAQASRSNNGKKRRANARRDASDEEEEEEEEEEDEEGDEEEDLKGEELGLLPRYAGRPGRRPRTNHSLPRAEEQGVEEEQDGMSVQEDDEEEEEAVGGGLTLRKCEMGDGSDAEVSEDEIVFAQDPNETVEKMEVDEAKGKRGKRGPRSRESAESKEAKKAKAETAAYDAEDDISETSEDRIIAQGYASEEVEDPDVEDPIVREQRTRHQPLRAARGPAQPQLPEDCLEGEILNTLKRRAGPFITYEFLPIISKDKGVLNPHFDFFKEKLPKAPEIIVFHGTTRTCAKSIARNGFEIRHALQRGREGNNHIFFATDPRVADCYAKPSRMRFILPGTWQKNIIVSRLLLVREAHITTTGCTGGTVKIHESALWCLRPIYRLRYYIQNPKRKLKLKHLSKGNLEEDRGLLNQALKTHLITVSSTEVEDFNNLERPVL